MPEPIRILRVIARLNVGGPSLHVAHLSKGLAERGYETTLLTGSVSEDEGSMEYVADEFGLHPLVIPSLQREVSPLADARSIAEVRRLIQELRPHVLHTHTAKAGTVGRAAALLCGEARPPVVVHTFHGHVLRGYFGPGQTAFFRRLERTFARVSDALIAVSPEVRDDLVRLGVAPARRITVIRLGLDLDARVLRPEDRGVFRASLGIDPDAYVVAWLGRMTEIKRVDTLLASFAAVREARNDAQLVLVGDGPLRDALERHAFELGIADSCHFIGFRQDVAPVFAACDVVALTSANEGTPVSLIEALAAERPVVSTDVGGVADVVEEGRSGLLAAPGRIEEITAGLLKLADDDALRRRFGEYGRASVVERYSVPRLLDDVDLLYRSLLEQRSGRVRRVVTALNRPLTPALPPASVRRTRAKRRLRVVIVSQYFPPEIGATQSRVQSFAEYLAGSGHDVTVIAEFPNHPYGVIPQAYRGRLVQDDRSNSYRVLRVWVKASHEKTQATRIAFYLSFMGMATAVAPLAGRPDVVVATSPPLFTALAGLAIARMSGAPFVLDVRDLWPAAAVSLNQIGHGSARLGEVFERMLYREASQVVAVTRPFCAHIDAIRKAPPPTILIPNGTLEKFFVDGDPEVREAYGFVDGRFVVTFAGTHGIAQGLPSVLQAAARVDGATDFVFVGDGPLKDTLIDQAARMGLTNVRFLPQVTLEEIPRVLAASDALLVPLSAHPTFLQFVPSKMIDFMATGRPVLVSAAGEAARLLELSGGGLAVPPEDPEALARSALWLSEHPEDAKRMGENGRTFARKRLRSEQAERLEEVLLDVVSR